MKTKTSKNYYDILGLKEDCDEKAIKKAYRKLAMLHHPDKNQGNKEAEEKFKEISKAYEILSDPEKRKQYDQFGSESFNSNNSGFSGFSSENMNMAREAAEFFARQHMQHMHHMQQSYDINIKVVCRISLKDAIKGGKIPVSLTRATGCEKCEGNGFTVVGEQCKSCNGKGYLVNMNGPVLIQRTCSTCGGTGGGKRVQCKHCNGNGYSETDESMIIKIPAGINSSSVLRIKNKGNSAFKDGKKYEGDLFVIIDYPSYENGIGLKDGNIFASIKVPFVNVISGDSINVDILGLKKIPLKLNPIQVSGHQYEIQGEGSTTEKTAYIKVFIDNPSKNISEEDREKLSKLMKEIYGESDGQYKPTDI